MSDKARELCGGFTYTAYFMGEEISATSEPMSYDAATRTFTFFSDDWAMIGDREFAVKAHYAKTHQSVNDPPASAFLEIFEPCYLTAPEQMSMPPYFYSGELTQFFMNPFIIEPPLCDLEYTCEVVSAPRELDTLDLCDV